MGPHSHRRPRDLRDKEFWRDEIAAGALDRLDGAQVAALLRDGVDGVDGDVLGAVQERLFELSLPLVRQALRRRFAPYRLLKFTTSAIRPADEAEVPGRVVDIELEAPDDLVQQAVLLVLHMARSAHVKDCRPFADGLLTGFDQTVRNLAAKAGRDTARTLGRAKMEEPASADGSDPGGRRMRQREVSVDPVLLNASLDATTVDVDFDEMLEREATIALAHQCARDDLDRKLIAGWLLKGMTNLELGKELEIEVRKAERRLEALMERMRAALERGWRWNVAPKKKGSDRDG